MTNDKQRERLVELLNQIRGDEIALANYEADILIDHLLANGVIVPPCGFKVGDTVYVVDRGLDVWWKGVVMSISYVDEGSIKIGVYDGLELAICDEGDLFLTFEEADEVLEGGLNVKPKES